MIYHNTPGTPPLEALTTFGVSAKESDSAIGQFGTGFKYAVAGILRLGGSIHIDTAEGVRHTFGTRAATIRGKEFKIVQMDGRDLGFTTDTGKHWEPWMLFRELHSNTLDEGGTTGRAPGPAGWSSICVSLREYTQAWEERATIFVEGTPVFSCQYADFYPGTSPYIYYKGVRVGKAFHDYPYTMNVREGVTLTEDRTCTSIFFYERALQRALVLAPEPIFREVCRANLHNEMFDFSSDLEKRIDAAYEAGHALPPRPKEAAAERRIRNRPLTATHLDDFDEGFVVAACAKAQRMGYRIKREDVTVTSGLSADTLGRVIDDKIFITENAISMGEQQLLMTILEEHFHIASGAGDYSRRFQDYLLEQVVRQFDRH